MGRFGFAVVSALVCAVATTVGLYAIGLAFRCGSEYATYVVLLAIIVVGPVSLLLGALLGALAYPVRRIILFAEVTLFVIALGACITMQLLPSFVQPHQMQCNYE